MYYFVIYSPILGVLSRLAALRSGVRSPYTPPFILSREFTRISKHRILGAFNFILIHSFSLTSNIFYGSINGIVIYKTSEYRKMPRIVKPLTDTEIKLAKPKDKLYKLSDGQNLFFVVQPNGTKFFRYDYTFQNKRKSMSFGTYLYMSNF